MHFPLELDVLGLIGLTTILAFLVGQVFRRLGIPQVVGFVLTGGLLGPSFIGLIDGELNSSLLFVTEIALCLIGFDIGAHLCFSDLREKGKSILCIVIFEAFSAFALVFIGVYLIINYTSLFTSKF